MLPTIVATLLAVEGDGPARKVVVPTGLADQVVPVQPPPTPAAKAFGDAPRLHLRLTEKVEALKGELLPPSNLKLQLMRLPEQTPVCTLPCDLMVSSPQQEFVVTGPETMTSAKFTLKDLAAKQRRSRWNDDRLDATVRPGARGLWSLGLASTIVGSLGVAAGGALALEAVNLSAAAARCASMTGSFCFQIFTAQEVMASAVIPLIVGTALLLVGVPLLLINSTVVQSTDG